MLELKGQRFLFDVTNPDHLERFENAYREMQEEAERIDAERDGKQTSQYIREACRCAMAFLDRALGDGTAQKLFGESVSLIDCTETVSDMANQVAEQLAGALRRFSEFSPARLEQKDE